MTLPHGFKASAERRALQLRSEMGLTPADRLGMTELAKHLHITVVSAERLIDIARLEELERLQAFAFSAVTFEINGKPYIVTNPLRVEGRVASDIAHEISHILLEHELSEISEIDGVPFRTCRPDQEEEATTLGGTLLLPRPLLVNAAKQRLGPEDIARQYAVTVDMARFRYNTTGVAKQIRSRSR